VSEYLRSVHETFTDHIYATLTAHPWASGYVLGTMLVGLGLIAVWVVWEAKFARHPMVPGELFKGQRIVGLAYVIAFAAGMNFFCKFLTIIRVV
jgi:hypothetical protein